MSSSQLLCAALLTASSILSQEGLALLFPAMPTLRLGHHRNNLNTVLPQESFNPLFSTFAADGSEYSSKDTSDLDMDEELSNLADYERANFDEEDGEVPTVEHAPVPMSKNAGNRFVSIIWDRLLDDQGRDSLDLFYNRIALTEDHVMFCRKANLYNETFNADSMVDVLWSLPMYVID